jgi:hypothetical protein
MSFCCSLQKSTRWASRKLGNVSHMIEWRVLCKWLAFRLYKSQLLQELKPSDQPCRRDYCINMLNRLKEHSLFLDKTVFGNKATFHLSGKVNHHNLINLIIWGSTQFRMKTQSRLIAVPRLKKLPQGTHTISKCADPAWFSLLSE